MCFSMWAVVKNKSEMLPYIHSDIITKVNKSFSQKEFQEVWNVNGV